MKRKEKQNTQTHHTTEPPPPSFLTANRTATPRHTIHIHMQRTENLKKKKVSRLEKE